METVQFTVHEFMTVMGTLAEKVRDGKGVDAGSVWHKWKDRYRTLDKELEKLDMMDRADMLFDGKVTFDDVSKPHLEEVLAIVDGHIKHEKQLIEDGDPDADEEEVDIWRTLHARLETTLDMAD